MESGEDYLIFTPNEDWQKKAIELLNTIIGIQESESPNELKTINYLSALWEIVYNHIDVSKAENTARRDAYAQGILQIMMQYIQTNYQYKISLDDIAHSVNISRSSVGNLFNRYLHTSPINYVISYRLKMAAKLLINTEMSVAEIAESVGFDNSGYFHRKFLKEFGCTPHQYRNS